MSAATQLTELIQLGKSQSSFAFDAFINGARGRWLNEPGDLWNNYQFGTDFRNFGQFNYSLNQANARIFTFGWIRQY